MSTTSNPDENTDISSRVNIGWLTTSASQIFLMQYGFTCFEVGFVEIHWSKSIIIKNLEATIIGILTFIIITYSFASSPTGLTYHQYGFIGDTKLMFFHDRESDYVFELLFISATYAATATTIISGAVLERMKNNSYIIWCFLITAIIYSFASYWTWNKNGWLRQLGYIDCAGSIAVHGTGGMASLIAVRALGPRMNAVRNGKLKKIPNSERYFC